MCYDIRLCTVQCIYVFFFFKQKPAYEVRISDWSSDVCSSDLVGLDALDEGLRALELHALEARIAVEHHVDHVRVRGARAGELVAHARRIGQALGAEVADGVGAAAGVDAVAVAAGGDVVVAEAAGQRSEEQTSELQSLMR